MEIHRWPRNGGLWPIATGIGDAIRRIAGGGAVTAGATDYLAPVTSQTAVLQTELEALNLDTLQLRTSVDLIRAL